MENTRREELELEKNVAPQTDNQNEKRAGEMRDDREDRTEKRAGSMNGQAQEWEKE